MFKNGLYNLSGTVARIGLSIASVPLLLRFLGPSDYGLYAILMAIINISVLSEWSICMVLIVFVPQAIPNSGESDTLLGNTLQQALAVVIGFAFITATLLWIISPWMPLAFPNLNENNRIVLQCGCQLSAIVVLFRLLQQYFVGIEQSHGQYKLFNSINTVFNISQTALILVVAHWKKGLLPLIGVQATTTAIFLVIHGFYCYRHKWLAPLQHAERNKWDQFPKMLIYSSRTFIGGVGSAFFSQGDRLVVGRLLGLEASGIYAAITSVATQIHTLSTITIQPLMPNLTKLLEQKSSSNFPLPSIRESLETIISSALTINAVLAVSLGSFIIMLAPEISSFLFKNDLSMLVKASNGLKITATIYTLYSLNAIGYYMLLSIRREIVTTIVSLLCGPFSLLLIAVLANYYGIIGALYGNLGYLLTLYMIIDGFRSFHLRLILWIKAVWQPLLILVLALGASILIEAAINRIAVLCLLLFTASLPLIKAGWKYFIVDRKKSNI